MAARRWAAEQAAQYAGSEDRPLGSFLVLTAGYGAVTSLLAAAALRRRSVRLPVGDLALTAVATAKLSRLLSRDRVTSPLRAPVTTFEGFASGSEVEEAPRGTGMRLALGELVTCPYCLAQWVGTGLLAGLLLRPRETRLATSLLTLLAINDTVQAAQARLGQG